MIGRNRLQMSEKFGFRVGSSGSGLGFSNPKISSYLGLENRPLGPSS